MSKKIALSIMSDLDKAIRAMHKAENDAILAANALGKLLQKHNILIPAGSDIKSIGEYIKDMTEALDAALEKKKEVIMY